MKQKETIQNDLKYIDQLSTDKIVDTLQSEISKAVKKIKDSNAKITKSVDLISKTILNGGKLYIYGCNTPARVAIVENLELQRLFALNPDIIQSHILGEDKALKSIAFEPKDIENTGRAEIVLSFVKESDVLIILNNKDNPKYTKGAVTVAKQKNIPVILITQDETLSEYSDISIVIPSKNKKISVLSDTYASTLYKIILNIIFTGVMIKLGKMYKDYIIDPNVEKHKEQATQIVMKFGGTDEETANEILEKCKYRPKIALVMIKKNVDLKTAINLIKKKNGKINDLIK